MKKIYYNKDLIKSYPHTVFLSPIQWIFKYDDSKLDWYDRKYYDINELQERTEKGKNIIKYSSIESCDFVVYPKNFRVDLYSELKEEAIKAKKHNKKIVVFFYTDIEAPIYGINNLIVFRPSLTQDSPKNEYPMPYFCPEINKNIQPSDLNNISIWYVWYEWNPSLLLKIWDKFRSFSPIKRFLYHLIYNQKLRSLIKDKWCINPSFKMDTLAFQLLQVGKWIIVRSKAIGYLKNSKYKFNFIKRDKVLGPKTNSNLKNEYINNMLQSTFVLVARWYWNNAYRLYEAMSLWKIPLLIDTSFKLPFEKDINYRNLFLRVPYNDIENIDIYIDKYLKIHDNKLDNIQQEIKKLFNNKLRMFPFFKLIIENIVR